jgi:peptide/nickel transport system substrate-binding protein
VLDKFNDYYGGSKDIPPTGQAKLDRVIFKPIPEVASRIAALLSGDVDIAVNIPPFSVDVINKSPDCRIVSCNGTRSYFLGMNCLEKPFSDKKVRLAVNLGIDLKSIVGKILGEYAVILAGPLVPNAFGFDDKLKSRGYDPKEAARLLKEAGYGSGLDVELDAEENDKDIAETIANQLDNIGIRVKINVWKWDVLYPKLQNKKSKLFINSWGNASLDPAGIIIPLFRSDGRGNFMGYSNKKVDELIDISQTSFDMSTREKCFIDIQRILREDIPCVFGYAKKEIYGVRNRVHNWQPRPDGMLNMHRVWIVEN